MSAGLPPITDIARRGWHGRKVPTAVFAAVRGTGFMECRACAVHSGLMSADPDHLGRLLGFFRDEFAEFGGRARKTVPPRSVNRAFSLGSSRPALISVLSFSMILLWRGGSLRASMPSRRLSSRSMAEHMYFPVPPMNSKVPRMSGSFTCVTVYLAKTFDPSVVFRSDRWIYSSIFIPSG